MRHNGSSIQPKTLSIEVGILKNSLSEVTELVELPYPPQGALPPPDIFELLWHVLDHGSLESVGCDGGGPDAELAEIPRHRHKHTIYCTFGSRVGTLACSSLVCVNTAHEEEDTALSRFVHGIFLHGGRSILGDVD